MMTINEQIEAWKKQYNEADIKGKYLLQQMAPVDIFKAQQIWEFVKSQPEITKEQYIKAIETGEIIPGIKPINKGKKQAKVRPKKERVSAEENINKIKEAIDKFEREGKEDFSKQEVITDKELNKNQMNYIWNKLSKEQFIERINPSEPKKNARWRKRKQE